MIDGTASVFRVADAVLLKYDVSTLSHGGELLLDN